MGRESGERESGREFFHYLVHDIYFFVTGTRRVRANEVYQEYIKDKNHYHMNATRVCQCCMLSVRDLSSLNHTFPGWYCVYMIEAVKTTDRVIAILLCCIIRLLLGH